MISIEGGAMVDRHEADVGRAKESTVATVPSTKEAVKALHAAFSGHRRPQRLDVAPTKDPTFVTGLLAVPLAEIDDRAILRYSLSAMTTIGTEADFANFLPRLLEVAIEGPAAGLAEPFILAGKLDMAEWRSWSPAEQSAIEGALRSAFVSRRAADPDDADAFPWLQVMLRAGVDPLPAMEAWLVEPGAAPLLQLTDCLVRLACDVERADVADLRPEILRGVVDWFTADEVGEAILRRLDEVPPIRSHHLDRALDCIAALADSPFAVHRRRP